VLADLGQVGGERGGVALLGELGELHGPRLESKYGLKSIIAKVS
jgi:hypothetical protein